jgi:dihydrofolate reductase
MPKYVVSSTLRDPSWTNSRVLNGEGNLADVIGRVKDEVPGEILVNGSVRLVRALLELGLVDELRLMVFPTVLGAGLRLFGDTGEPADLTLVDSKPAGETFILVYRSGREAAPAA